MKVSISGNLCFNCFRNNTSAGKECQHCGKPNVFRFSTSFDVSAFRLDDETDPSSLEHQLKEMGLMQID